MLQQPSSKDDLLHSYMYQGISCILVFSHCLMKIWYGNQPIIFVELRDFPPRVCSIYRGKQIVEPFWWWLKASHCRTTNHPVAATFWYESLPSCSLGSTNSINYSMIKSVNILPSQTSWSNTFVGSWKGGGWFWRRKSMLQIILFLEPFQTKSYKTVMFLGYQRTYSWCSFQENNDECDAKILSRV